MRATRSIAATVGLVLALGLAGCGKDPAPELGDEPSSPRAPSRVATQVTTDAKTCPVGDASCRRTGAVRWSVPVDLPLAVLASKEHGLIEILWPYDGPLPDDDYEAQPEDYLFVGATDVVYLQFNGQVVVVSADTGVVEYDGEAAGHEVPEAETSTDLGWSGIEPKRFGFVVDDLLVAEGSPIVDDVPLRVAVGCAETVSNGHGASPGRPVVVGRCAAPVLFAVNS